MGRTIKSSKEPFLVIPRYCNHFANDCATRPDSPDPYRLVIRPTSAETACASAPEKSCVRAHLRQCPYFDTRFNRYQVAVAPLGIRYGNSVSVISFSIIQPGNNA